MLNKGVIIGVLVFFQSVLFAEPQWLQYKTSPSASEEFGVYGSYISIFEKKPADVKMPEFGVYEQKFFKWKNEMDQAKFRWGAFDRTRKFGLYDVLYIDSNGDGNLADEQPVKGKPRDRYRMLFGPVAIYFKGEDGPITYHLCIEFYSYSSSSTYFRIMPGCWYEGDVQIDGKSSRVAVLDYNCNGVFSDKSENFNSDRLFIDVDKQRRDFYVGKYLEINNKLYCLGVAKDGAFIELSPAMDVSYGIVKMPDTLSSFVAGGVNGLFSKTPVNGEVSLPEGDYRIQTWSITRKDDKGKEWTLSGSGFPDKYKLNVSKDKPVTLDIGEPVFSTVKIQSLSNTSNSFNFNQELVGKQGERVSLLAAGSRPEAPSIQIRSKTGEYDRTFKLEYG